MAAQAPTFSVALASTFLINLYLLLAQSEHDTPPPDAKGGGE